MRRSGGKERAVAPSTTRRRLPKLLSPEQAQQLVDDYTSGVPTTTLTTKYCIGKRICAQSPQNQQRGDASPTANAHANQAFGNSLRARACHCSYRSETEFTSRNDPSLVTSFLDEASTSKRTYRLISYVFLFKSIIDRGSQRRPCCLLAASKCLCSIVGKPANKSSSKLPF